MLIKVLEKITLWFYGPVLEEGEWSGAKVVLVKSLIPKWAAGQAVGNTIYLSSTFFDDIASADDRLLDHEYYHTVQWDRYGGLGFLVRYYWEYLRLMIKYRDAKKAHNYHSMEMEANRYADDRMWATYH